MNLKEKIPWLPKEKMEKPSDLVLDQVADINVDGKKKVSFMSLVFKLRLLLIVSL